MLLTRGKQGNYRALIYAEELELLIAAVTDPEREFSAEETLCLAQITQAWRQCADTGEQVMIDARPQSQK